MSERFSQMPAADHVSKAAPSVTSVASDTCAPAPGPVCIPEYHPLFVRLPPSGLMPAGPELLILRSESGEKKEVLFRVTLTANSVCQRLEEEVKPISFISV